MLTADFVSLEPALVGQELHLCLSVSFLLFSWEGGSLGLRHYNVYWNLFLLPSVVFLKLIIKLLSRSQT